MAVANARSESVSALRSEVQAEVKTRFGVFDRRFDGNCRLTRLVSDFVMAHWNCRQDSRQGHPLLALPAGGAASYGDYPI
jgi:hypothetical protein